MDRMKINYVFLTLFAILLCSCDKVSPTGILLGNTAPNDRVAMSMEYLYSLDQGDYHYRFETAADLGEYTFLVGADSHIATDLGRMQEMLDISMANHDLFCCHLGDIADTKPEYYAGLKLLLDEYAKKWLISKGYIYNEENGYYYFINPDTGEEELVPAKQADSLRFPLYVAVGNHDITHNGWTLFSSLFHTSFFQVFVMLGDNKVDRLIFLDSANGTMGNYQIDLIDDDVLTQQLAEHGYSVRHSFVFTHDNIFRPQAQEFAATYARDELYFLLNKYAEWNTDIVFMGHVHAWDEREFGGVTYLTLPAMSERNAPEPGDYLVRVKVKADGTITYERVRMNYTVAS